MEAKMFKSAAIDNKHRRTNQAAASKAFALVARPILFLLITALHSVDQQRKCHLASAISVNELAQSRYPPDEALWGASESAEYHWDPRRPIWNIAHMVNSIKELHYRLEKGANAIELDVSFNSDGVPEYAYHGLPCDCMRHCHQQEDFNEYLRYVRHLSRQGENGIGKNLSLMLLDLKLSSLDHKAKVRAGIELANSIERNLFESDIWLVLSVNHVSDIELIRNFLYQLDRLNANHLLQRIGFDVGMNDDIQQIEAMWNRLARYGLNLWQGDGYTNCISPFYNLRRLSMALMKRNSETGYPKKVYQWTIDLHDRIRESLRLGVDAVMTNHPERVVSILKEPEMAQHYRLASRADNPFVRIVQRASWRAGESARYQRSASPAALGAGFLGGVSDLMSSWFSYVKEIPFLSLPTTVRWFLPNAAKLRSRVLHQTSLRPSSTTASTQAQTMVSSEKSPKVQILEARTDNATESSTTTEAATSDSNSNTTDTNTTLSGPERPAYVGPKWYTSLVSNLLVSALKVVLPADP